MKIILSEIEEILKILPEETEEEKLETILKMIATICFKRGKQMNANEIEMNVTGIHNKETGENLGNISLKWELHNEKM